MSKEAKEVEVVFEPFDKQLEFFKLVFSRQYKFILFGGSIRLGKTYALLGLFILLCKLFPGSKYLVVRKDLERIKNTVLPTFKKLIPSNFQKQEPTQHNGWRFVATNGSIIQFFGENADKDPDLKRFRGIEYDAIGFEEMDITKKGFEVGMERCGTWRMDERKADKEAGIPIPPQIAIATSNTQQGWVKKDIYDKHINGTLNKKWFYLPASVYDNPYIDAEWIQDRKENMSPLRFKMMVEGDWEVNLNTEMFFYDFSKQKHCIKGEYEINQFEPLWFSFDFNYDPCTCIIGQKIEGYGIYIYETIQVKGGTYELCQKLKHYMHHPGGIYVTGDASGGRGTSSAGNLAGGRKNTDFEIIKEELELSKRQFVLAERQNPLLSYSRDVCNRLFFSCPVFIYEDYNEQLVYDLETGQPKVGKDGEFLGIIKDRDNNPQDAGDAMRYKVNAFFPNGFKDISRFSSFIINKV